MPSPLLAKLPKSIPLVNLPSLSIPQQQIITSGRGKLRCTVESSWAWLLCVPASWSIFDRSCNKLHRADQTSRKSESQEWHLTVKFQNKTPCADSQLCKDEQLPNQQKFAICSKTEIVTFCQCFQCVCSEHGGLCYVGNCHFCSGLQFNPQ